MTAITLPNLTKCQSCHGYMDGISEPDRQLTLVCSTCGATEEIPYDEEADEWWATRAGHGAGGVA